MFHKLTINNQQLAGYKLHRGDDQEITLIIYQPDQTGASIKFVAKLNIDDPDSSAVISKTSATDGGITVVVSDNVLTAQWSISSAETKALADGTSLIYGVERVVGGKTKTIEEGSFSIEADVVHD